MADARISLTVVLLDYNGGVVLKRCLESLARQTQLPDRVVFVDNGSRVYEPQIVASTLGPRYSEIVEYVRIENNAGYVKGMNQGLEHVLAMPEPSEWVMTLSNDTELAADFFAAFGELATNLEPTTGMLAPKLRDMHDHQMLDGTGIGVCLDGMSTARGQREVDHRQYDHQIDILLPNGVSAIYRVAMLKDVGLMDECFWSYCEDTDLGLRGWLAGWDCRFVPQCVVSHARSTTLGEHSLSKLYYAERNHYWVAIKNLPLIFVVLNPAFSLFRYLVQIYALLVAKGQGEKYGRAHSSFTLAFTTLRAVVGAARGAPHAFAQRLRLRKLKRRSTRETFYALWRKRMRFHELILK